MNRDTVICYCKGVTLGNILDSIENGATNHIEVIDATGAASGCGRCVDRIESIVQQEKK